ncbi:MAG: WD40 repeat domain-containing protein [Prochloraceae cyanobacterium]|nr:WD40 repeat domain-containing protein [Prochloraceae cyanobacterium]
MSSANLSENQTPSRSYYPSLASLREAHKELLIRHHQTAFAAELASEITAFISKGSSTGVVLDGEEDRWAAQGILDYWLSVLYSEGVEPPDATLAEFDVTLAPELPDEDCPYLGLEAFLEKDKNLFFGRNRLLKQLLDKLKQGNLLTVVGSSGSGKSSAVRGGLLPRLKANAIENSSNWHYYKAIVPGSDPLLALAKTLCPDDVEVEQWCAEQVSAFLANPQHLAQLITDANQQPAVLIIDQFEEIFNLCGEVKRQAFIDNLLGLIQLPDSKHRVIITMRSDFESNVTKFAKFQKVFEPAQVRVLGLNAYELREAIEKPAQSVGLKFESNLVDNLIGDVLGQEAALPLLQFTLLKLWDNRERNRVTWASYQQLGGGKEALSRSADDFYQELIPEDQNAARRILLQMVNFKEESLEVTSKRIPKKDLFLAGEAEDRIQRAIAKLKAARLVKITLGDNPQDDQIEVAHEALIRNWGTLVDWIEDERENKRQRLRLESKAKEWQSKGKTKDALLRGSLLEDAQQYRDDEGILGEFVRRSSRYKKNQLRWMIGSFISIISILSVSLIFATSQQYRAQICCQKAELKRYILASEAAFSRHQGLESLIEAVRATRNFEKLPSIINSNLEGKIKKVLYQGTTQTYERNRLKHQDIVNNAQFSPDGKYIVTASRDKTAKLWTTEGKLLHTLSTHQDIVNNAQFSPDGKYIVTASGDKTAKLWTTEGKLLHTLSTHQDVVNNAQFSPDGKYIVTASGDKTAKLWTTEGKLLHTLSDHQDIVNNAQFSPDGKYIVTASGDKTAKLWTTEGKLLHTLSDHQDIVNNAQFSPDGKYIVTASRDKTAKLWTTEGKLLHTLSDRQDIVNNAQFSPDGKYIVTASGDKTAKLWTTEGELLHTLSDHQDIVNNAQFSPDGKYIVTASGDNTAKLWTTEGELLHTLSAHQDIVNNAQFSPDGKYIVTASGDKTAKLWTTEGEFRRTLSAHQDFVYNAQFSPDGKYIVTASRDKTAKLWTTEGELLHTLSAHQDFVYNAQFSPDGKYIVTASGDNTAKLAKLVGILQIDYLLSQACQQIEGYLKYNPDAEDDRDLCEGVPKKSY